MARATVHRLAAVVVTLAVGSGLYWMVGDLGTAAAAGLVWGVAVGLALRIARLSPSHTTGDTWADGRWTGLGVGATTLGALLGVSPTLPVDADVRFGLGVLVLGVGFVGYASGSLAEIDRQSSV